MPCGRRKKRLEVRVACLQIRNSERCKRALSMKSVILFLRGTSVVKREVREVRRLVTSNTVPSASGCGFRLGKEEFESGEFLCTEREILRMELKRAIGCRHKLGT